MESDPEFLLRRAKEESVKAIESDEPAAGTIHEQLAIRYSAQAAMVLANEDQAGPNDAGHEGT